jgi:hypothetical protein
MSYHISSLLFATCPSYETTHSWNSEPQPATSSAVSNIEYRTAECRRMESLCSIFFKIDRIHYFDIRHSLFDILFFKVSFSIKLAAFQTSGWVEFQLPLSEFRLPLLFSHKPVGPDIVNEFVIVKGYRHIDALQVSGKLTQSL